MCVGFYKLITRDFPGGTVVGNPPAKAGNRGSSPGLGRSHMPQSTQAHVPQLLSLRSRAHVPQLLSPCAATREATAMRSLRTAKKSSPRSPQLEKARAATKTRRNQKLIN